MYFHPTSDRMITSCLKHQPGRGRLRGYAFTMLIGDDQLSVGKIAFWLVFVCFLHCERDRGWQKCKVLGPKIYQNVIEFLQL